MEETRSHLAQDDAIVLSIQYFIMRWVLLPSHPGISTEQKEETRNLPSQGNFLQYHSLPLIVSRDNVHLTSHHSWLYILILMKDSFHSSVYPRRRSSVPTHSVQISTLALSPPETLADKHSSQESATHLNSFIFIGQAWNNCFSLRKPLQPWSQLMDQSTSGPNPWLATKSFWFPLLRTIRPGKKQESGAESSHPAKKTGVLGTGKHPVTMAPISMRTPVPSFRKVSIAPAPWDTHFLSIKPSAFELTWVDSGTSNPKALTRTVTTGTTKDCVLKLVGEMKHLYKVKFYYYLERNF